MKFKITGFFILTGMYLSIYSCDDLPCRAKLDNPKVNVALYRATLAGIDTIKAYIGGVYAEIDTFSLQDIPLKGSNKMQLSLNHEQNFTRFGILIDSLLTSIPTNVPEDSVFLSTTAETFIVYHSNSQELFSQECGFVHKYTIDSVSTTFTHVDSALIMERNVQINSNKDEETIVHLEFFF